MEKFDIRKGDDFYLTLKKWYGCKKYEEFKDVLTYDGDSIASDLFIYTVNNLNEFHNGDLDISLITNDGTFRLFDKKLREDVATYDIDFDFYESALDYFFKEIKQERFNYDK